MGIDHSFLFISKLALISTSEICVLNPSGVVCDNNQVSLQRYHS